MPTVAPHSAVVEVGAGTSPVHDQVQVLARERDRAGGLRAVLPVDHVHTAVAVADQRGLTVLHRGVGMAVEDETAMGIAELEAAVERREQLASACLGHVHRAARESIPRAPSDRG